MVCINFVRINPTSEYLDVNVYSPNDFDIVSFLTSTDGINYTNRSNYLTPVVPTGYSKEQIMRIPVNAVNGGGKKLIFLRFNTRYVDNKNAECKPECYSTKTVTNIAVADIRFSYDAKVKLIKKDPKNPSCFNAYINDIVEIGFMEAMLEQSMFFEQFDKALFWMLQLENKVQFINNNY